MRSQSNKLAGSIVYHMTYSKLIAQHLRDVHFGGNWTSVNLRDTLKNVDWQQATVKMESFNTIAALVYHIHYYISAVLNVVQGGPLTARDKYSFDHPVIESPEAWQQLLDKTWADAETFAVAIERLPDDQLQKLFADVKYGTWYRNLQGIIEHTHYHLGQIVLLKKMMKKQGFR